MAAGCDLETVVHCASRLIGDGACARQVIVVANRRLTYDELTRCRQDASRLRLEIRMDGAGTVTLWHQSATVIRPHRRLGWWRHVRGLLHRHPEHAADWRMP